MRLKQPENGILCFQAALARLNDDERQPETAAPHQQKQSKQKQPKKQPKKKRLWEKLLH